MRAKASVKNKQKKGQDMNAVDQKLYNRCIVIDAVDRVESHKYMIISILRFARHKKDLVFACTHKYNEEYITDPDSGGQFGHGPIMP